MSTEVIRFAVSTVPGAPLDMASFTACKDSVRKYCSGCLFKGQYHTKVRRQSTELVSDTGDVSIPLTFGAVHGKAGRGGRGQPGTRGFQPLSCGRATEPTEMGMQGKKTSIPEKEEWSTEMLDQVKLREKSLLLSWKTK